MSGWVKQSTGEDERESVCECVQVRERVRERIWTDEKSIHSFGRKTWVAEGASGPLVATAILKTQLPLFIHW